MELDFLKEAKEKAVNEILNSDLSKIEKLRAIEKNGLWGYSSFINHEFRDWEEEAKILEKTTAQYNFDNGLPDKHGDITKYFYASGMTDSIFDPSKMYYEKYETVSYADALEQAFESYAEDFEDEFEKEYNGEPIAIITTRNPIVSIFKTKEEIIDAVYNYCITNKILGFKNDW